MGERRCRRAYAWEDSEESLFRTVTGRFTSPPPPPPTAKRFILRPPDGGSEESSFGSGVFKGGGGARGCRSRSPQIPAAAAAVAGVGWLC